MSDTMDNKPDPEVSSSVIKRRSFLGGCLGVLGTVMAGGIIYPVLNYLQPPKKDSKNETVKIPLEELPAGGMKRFHIRGIPAVVVNAKEGFLAYSLVCSHLGCLVKWEGEKNEFLCPCHGARFSTDGSVISGPPPTGLEPFKIEVHGKEVWIS